MNRIHGKTQIPWNCVSQSRHRNSELSNVFMELLSSCPKAQQHWSLTRFMTTITAKTFLNTILASPAPVCQPGFFIFPLSESKLFLSFIWLYDSCPPVPSSSPGYRYLPLNLSSFTFFSFFALLKVPPLPSARKRKLKDTPCKLYVGDYLPRQPHLVTEDSREGNCRGK